MSPYRDRPVEESLDLFARMRAGEFPNGAMTLRARIDLTSGNFNMRDPVIYRINHMSHHRQGNKWCIYPMYDFAHPIQDALEGITHSLCSLEFEAHRPLYNWVIEHCELPARPRQIEFARLGIDHTVMSKRKLRRLVEEHYVSGWDDPRMPTLCGLRRRGYTAASIRNFCERIGVAKSPNVIEYGFLEHCLREDLNANAERTMAVLHPVKLTVTNYPEGQSETFTVENNPTDPTQGTHDITFSRHLWIEEDDFMEVPVPKYKRLTPNGPECRLKGAYLVTCTGCVKDESGRVVEVLCTYDPDSRGGDPADGRKVKGATLHWVDAENCLDAEVRLYDNLFSGRRARRPRQGLFGLPESRQSDGAHRLQGGAGDAPRGGGFRQTGESHRRQRPHVPVHAGGLLLHGQPGLHGGASGVRPQRVPEGQLQKVNGNKRKTAPPALPEALFSHPNHPFFRRGGGGGCRFWKGLSMRMMSSPNFWMQSHGT